MHTRARRSSSPRTSSRTRSRDLKASEITGHTSFLITPAGLSITTTQSPTPLSFVCHRGSSIRFVLKSTTAICGMTPRSTTPAPFARRPIGRASSSRIASGRTRSLPKNSANSEGVLPVGIEPHLPCDLGPGVVHDDDVALPLLRGRAPAPRARVLVRDREALLAGLRNLDGHRHFLRFPRPSERARSSSIHSIFPREGWRIVRPIFDSRGARSFTGTATLRGRPLSPIPRAPPVRPSTIVPSVIPWIGGKKPPASYFTVWYTAPPPWTIRPSPTRS